MNTDAELWADRFLAADYDTLLLVVEFLGMTRALAEQDGLDTEALDQIIYSIAYGAVSNKMYRSLA